MIASSGGSLLLRELRKLEEMPTYIYITRSRQFHTRLHGYVQQVACSVDCNLHTMDALRKEYHECYGQELSRRQQLEFSITNI